MSELLAGLNPEQRRAVETIKGPLLILAGAGSGKTRVLTRRVAYLLEQGVRPWNVLAVTFTNKAAGEMKERVRALVEPRIGPAANEIWVSTFHSTCVRLLRRDIEPLGYNRNFVIYDDDDQIRVLKQILGDLKIDPKRSPPSLYRGLIDKAKNRLEEPGEGEAGDHFFPKVYRAYADRLKAANALDFNDLVNCVVKLWEQHPDVLERWRSRWRYVLVDEYQDTNAAQYKLIKLLCDHGERNLAVVGDDDQSIYSFRGADIQNILDFEKDFPSATVVRLEQNYRSTGTILKAASALVKRNTMRKDKTLWTDAPEGELIKVVRAEDEVEEAGLVVGEIRRLMATRRAADFAIIYRTNAQSRPIEQALMQARIPHVLVGGKKFYERREVRDLVAYLKLVVNPADDVAFARVINVPTRGLGDKAIAQIADEANRLGVPMREAAKNLAQAGGRVGNALAAFNMMMNRFESLALTIPPGELVLTVAKDTGYRAELEAEKTDEAEGRLENIDALSRAVAEDEDLGVDEDGRPFVPATEMPMDRLRSFLDRVSLAGQADELPDEGTGAVTLLTAHLAKGLEYPVVFVVGLVERCFPHARAELDADIEEERRLAYVAVTRARERLYLTWPARRRGFEGGYEPTATSRFLRELPRDVLTGALPPQATMGRTLLPPAPPRPPTRTHAPTSGRAFEDRAPLRPIPPRAPTLARAAPPTDRRKLVPDDLESYRVGVEVFHPLLGSGTISKREGIPTNPKLTIHFRDHGPRTVFAASAGLEILLP
jgi:DNA helicase-2/ATP-dependent DNA helicase PcrA